MTTRIDLNADMGESYGRWTLGDDEALMPLLTSANIACGFHAGDPHVMRKTVELALEHGVGIGAHVAFPDLIGFGRRRMAATPARSATTSSTRQARSGRSRTGRAGGSSTSSLTERCTRRSSTARTTLTRSPRLSQRWGRT